MTAVAALACGAICAADEIRVPGDWPTIQEAIFAAKDGDVVIVADGTYTGEFNKDIDFGGLAITVRSENGPENCIIDCEGDGRGFQFRFNETPESILRGFTVTNGTGSPGSAIWCKSGSSPTIDGCIFIANSKSGGNIVLWLAGDSLVTRCSFARNSGTSVFCVGGSPTIESCTIFGNATRGNGGGIGASSRATPTIRNSIIRNNTTSGSGGGINLGYSDALVSNCLIIGNNAGSRGGGVYSLQNASVFVGCTLSRNNAELGGAFYFTDFGAGKQSAIINSVLWGNTAKDGGPELAMDAQIRLTVSYSDVAGGWAKAYIKGGAKLVWGPGNIVASPKWVDPLGGDFRIGAGSPCIDAGDNTAVPDGTTVDLGGDPRFVDDPDTEDTGKGDPPIVDMGAYEFQGCTPCDANCDGSVDLADVEPFIALLLSGDNPCSDCAGDTNTDGSVDLADVEAFIGCLLG